MAHVIAVGDLMLGDSSVTVGFGVRSRYPGASLDAAFDGLRPVLSTAELCIGNLECSLTRAGLGRTRLARDQMRGDPEYAVVLCRAGFRALGLANNHAVQHGQAAFEETVHHLEAAGLVCFGLRGTGAWCSKPAILALANGARVGILGYCWRPRQFTRTRPPFAEGTPSDVLADVARLRQEVDHLVLSLHWGEEFVTHPSAAEVAFARSAVSAGADLVVGHHPHVLRPVERFGTGVIAYSLGNALCDMLWQDELRAGALLQCNFESGGLQATLCPLTIDDVYRPHTGPCQPVNGLPVEGFTEGEYRLQIEESLRQQRRALYRFAARHVASYPLRVGIELVATTALNKLSQLIPRRHG